MGMLGRIASALGDAGEAIGMQQLKHFSEQELLEKKDAMDQAREQRIIEAQAKITEASNTRADTLLAASNARQDAKDEITRGNQMTDQQFAINQAKIKSDADYTRANDPTNIDVKVKNASIDASGANTAQSKAATDKANEELNALRDKNDLLRKYNETTDVKEKASIADSIAVLSGKSTEVIKPMDIGTGEINKLTGVENKRSVLVDLSDINNPKILNVQPQYDAQHPKTQKLEDADVDALATEETNKQKGVRNSTSMFIPGDGVDNTKEWDAANEANKVKIKNGMLGSAAKNTDVDVPALQRAVMLAESNGNQNSTPKPTADNPHPTAASSMQMINDTYQRLGGKFDPKDRSPEALADRESVAKNYLADLAAMHNDPIEAAAEYTLGQPALAKLKRSYGDKWIDHVDEVAPGKSHYLSEISNMYKDKAFKKDEQTASSGRQDWDLDKNGNPIRLR